MATYISKNNRNVDAFRVHLLCLISLLFIFFSTPLFSEELANKSGTQEKFFFGDTKSYEKDSKKVLDNVFKGVVEESSGHEEANHSSQGKWVDEDISPLFPELKIIDELSTKKSLERMKKARRYYSHAKHSMKASKFDVDLANKKFSLDGVRYKWEKIDRKAELQRRIRKIKSLGRVEAITHLIKGIREADKIKNPAILKSDSLASLKSNLYREYVKQQFKSRNLHLCIDILQRYLKIRPSHQQEPEAHRLLASCYRHQEVIASRSRDNKTSWRFKSLKNDHLVKYALLAFGKDSAQYKYIKEKIEKDMFKVPVS